MLSGKMEVIFRVQAEVADGETVCVVGECQQLGAWRPQRARELRREHQKSNGGLSVWSTSVHVPAGCDIQYRYLVAYIQEADHEGDDIDIMVTRWESNVKPRRLSSTAHHQGDHMEKFGEYDGKQATDRGWLTGQTEVHLRLYGNPLHMWTRKYREQTYRIKCTTLDLRYRDMGSWEDEDSNQDFIEPSQFCNQARVAVLDGERDDLREQGPFGVIYNENDYMLMTAQTFYPDLMGYQLDFYVQPGGPLSKDTPHHVGVSFVLPVNLTDNIGQKVMHITGLNHRPIGEIKVDYLIVRPMQGFQCDMHTTFAHYWNRNRRAVDVGHRGSGSSYTTSKCAPVRENTIASLADAGSHGADFVEFDVQLSKDNVPVIYHDFKVCLSLKQKSEEIDHFEIPVNEISYDKLQLLKLDHVSNKGKNSADHHDHADRQPFPTLKRCMESIDPHIGFNIEIKYPMKLKSGKMEDDLKHYLERNSYVDIILSEILRSSGDRRVVLSCFDPDVCTMVRLKQNKYPIQFLFQGKTERYPPFADIRTGFYKQAISFVHAVSILGINPHTEEVLQDPNLIALAKLKKLVIICWGDENNNKDTIARLKELGVDGVIYDRIQELKAAKEKENIFKMEYKDKVELLNGQAAQLTSSVIKSMINLSNSNSSTASTQSIIASNSQLNGNGSGGIPYQMSSA